MAKIVWDKTGERRYETGVDHGVLYLSLIHISLYFPRGDIPYNLFTSANVERIEHDRRATSRSSVRASRWYVPPNCSGWDRFRHSPGRCSLHR